MNIYELDDERCSELKNPNSPLRSFHRSSKRVTPEEVLERRSLMSAAKRLSMELGRCVAVSEVPQLLKGQDDVGAAVDDIGPSLRDLVNDIGRQVDGRPANDAEFARIEQLCGDAEMMTTIEAAVWKVMDDVWLPF